MKTFDISIYETLGRTVSVEAKDVEEAKTLVEEKYRTEEIVLDANDILDVEFEEALA